MNKEKKISLAIVLSVFLLTAFFLYEALSLTINGDFTRFFPWDEMNDVYYVPKAEESVSSAKEWVEEESYYYSSVYKTNLNASVEAEIPEEEKDYPYTSNVCSCLFPRSMAEQVS